MEHDEQSEWDTAVPILAPVDVGGAESMEADASPTERTKAHDQPTSNGQRDADDQAAARESAPSNVESGGPNTSQAGPSKEATPKEKSSRGRDAKDRAKDSDRKDRDRGKDRERDRDREKERSKDKDRDRERDRDRDREKDRDRKKDKKEKDTKEKDSKEKDSKEKDSKEKDSKEKDPKEKESKEKKRSRSRSRSRDKSRRRSRSRDRAKRSRSRSRDRRKRRSRSRSRSRDRKFYRKSRSRSRSRDRRRRSSRYSDEGSSDDGYGGYKPRKRQEPPKAGEKSDVVVAVGPTPNTDPFWYLRQTPVPSDPAEALKMWHEQQLSARQLVLQQQAASAAQIATKAQSEVYVGNLASGLVTEAALRSLFNGALASTFPETATPGFEAVMNVSMHSDGRYAFVEFRTPEMATASLNLNGTVQLFNQSITVGRPSGYVDPHKAQQAAAAAQAALAAFHQGGNTPTMLTTLPQFAAALQPQVAAAAAAASAGVKLAVPLEVSEVSTQFLAVSGMVDEMVLQDEQEYQEVLEELEAECAKYGPVIEVKIPRPADRTQASALFNTQHYGRAFLKFEDPLSAEKAKSAIHGRLFAGNVVKVSYITANSYDEAN